MLTAVLITGNPRFTRGAEARDYYNEITEFLDELGVNVKVDPGADFTCPPKADFYVAHSRGCGRIRCFEGKPDINNFIMFGDPDGIMHPVDREWHEGGRSGIPPKEHFIFTAEQKAAIEDKVRSLTHAQTATPVRQPRQSASERPKVR